MNSKLEKGGRLDEGGWKKAAGKRQLEVGVWKKTCVSVDLGVGVGAGKRHV